MITFAIVGLLISLASGLATFLFLAIGLPEIPPEMMSGLTWVIDFLRDGVIAFKYVMHFNNTANVLFIFMTSIMVFYGVVMPIWRITMFIVRKIPGIN